MDKCSLMLKRIMLGIWLAVLGLTMLLVLRHGLESPSFFAAMAAGLFWTGGLFLLLRRGAGKELPHVLRSPWTPILLALLCLLMNLPWVLLLYIEPYSDYVVFWNTARALAEGTEIPAPWYIAAFPHLLGTSAFLSLLLRVFGSSVTVACVANVVLGALSCLPVYGIARLISDERTALLAELLWAIYPCRIMLNSMVFSEPLYTLLVLLFLWWLLYLDGVAMERGGGVMRALLRGVGLGILLALVKIIRPISPILIAAMVIWLFLLRGRGGQWRDWLLLLAALLVSYVLCGKLWDRSFETILGWAPASAPIYNVYVGFNEATRGTWSPEDMDLLFTCLEQSGSAAAAQMDMIPYLQERLTAGIDYLALFADKLLIFLGDDGLGGYALRFSCSGSFVRILMRICNVFYFGLLFASAAGQIRMFRSKSLGAEQLLPLYLLGLTLAHLLVEVNGRYHYSLTPILIICAALGLSPARPKGEQDESEALHRDPVLQ